MAGSVIENSHLPKSLSDQITDPKQYAGAGSFLK